MRWRRGRLNLGKVLVLPQHPFALIGRIRHTGGITNAYGCPQDY